LRRQIQRLAPGQAPVVVVALAADDGEGQSAEGLALRAGQRREGGDVVGGQIPLSDDPAHVGGLGLHRLLADLGEVALLIHHAAGLAAHAEGARLAGVPAAESSVELEGADVATAREHVLHGGEAACRAHPWLGHGSP